ncbi:LuxR C-terminal-related transcriptional regulator [Amnibacterium kyonggiense]|uniref:LuxR family maltose regulon positive regulatory protein n=1 Tax=Amnibacterium kyonggiense TaxID=595671 RepID=A0A4R7FSW9_9MICO|nr:LuxR C-terminal-related transcriptional regulator [Amnibacterium kyonggiense]TDS80940.1 LuxR family maltose regulon positive regulatory protein [Amnibacterium kyonggiense]
MRTESPFVVADGPHRRAAPPVVPRGAIARPRLALPGHGDAHVAVWAAAGSGKTALLAQWREQLQREGRPCPWVGVPPSGEDAPTLSSAVAAAWDDVDRAASDGPIPSGGAPALARRAPVTLFLDDLDRLTSGADGAWLRRLLASRPASLHVVMAGRRPPAALMRAVLPTAELRSEDLAFTAAEAAMLLRSRGIGLDDEALTALLDHTGGWVAALAALADRLARAGARSQLPPGFLTDQRSAGDQLVAELVADLSASDRDFLLATAAVDRFPVGLAAHLADRPDAAAVVERLSERLALISCDDREGEPVYRYHPMLRGHLRAESRRRDLDAAARTLTRASAWYRARGRPGEALELALRAEDVPGVARLVEQHGVELVFRGVAPRVHDALVLLERRGRSSPALHVVAAMVLLPGSSNRSIVRHHLACAAASAGELPPPLRLLLSALQILEGEPDDVPSALAVLRTRDRELRLATADPPAELRCAHVVVDWARARAADRCGDPDEAFWLLLECADATDSEHTAWAHLTVLQEASTLAARQGQWAQAVALADRMAAAPVAGVESDLAAARAGVAAVAKTYRETMSASTADLDVLLRSRAIAFDRHLAVEAAALREMVLLDAGTDDREAFARLEHLALTYDRPTPRVVASFAYHLVAATLVHRGRDRAEEAVALVRRALGREAAETVLAAALVQDGSGRPAQAEHGLLAALSARAPAWDPSTGVLVLLTLAAHADRCGRSTQADVRVVQALERAALLHARRPFVVRGGFGADLVAVRLGRLGPLDGFAAELVRERAALPRRRRPAGVDVPITEKEREVLRELPRYQSVGDIADRLQLSPNTIKTHIRSLYQKFGVSSRAQAVEQASRVGLL